MKFIPQFTRVKNEVVFYLSLLAGVIVQVVTQIESTSWDSATDYTGFAIVALGLLQRLGAFGSQTVDEIVAHARDADQTAADVLARQ